ncbi:MAG: PEGA domain-containing protein [Nitrosopumilaceae archaeon]|nr:PEGA domain-containing protein [Nitrosopumilaceae archaeon]NIU02382.1 PEGA domain-containing protein [Nitrosopumilaceae archaeon]NIU88839.1 PEGA domain-containing protein [Nitrosopumilaceae archaeon]NIV66963.1 PEGA domain-containing protein [Nitrosopumilaceae archaeon]NIX62983.1 PEGA domain-containing protein [Nitrosopumilaceae archaeon]
MVFCTQCGNKVDENHRYCANCGSSVSPPTESTIKESTPEGLVEENIIEQPRNVSEKKYPEIYVTDDVVDRKILFDDGMLVLTSKDLILYTSDEKDELKRFPVHSIESCSYSTIRGGLVVKRRINEEDNFQNHLTQKQSQFADIKSQKEFYEDELRNTRIRDHRDELKSKIANLDEQLSILAQEIKELESDPTKIQTVQQKVADTKKEIFKLPKNFESNHTARDEYRLWEYAVNRRMLGLTKLKITTMPYDAVVSVNGNVVGSTPITFDKPLIDEAILEGKYRIKVLKEEYEPFTFNVSTDLKRGSILEEIELQKRDHPDSHEDQMIEDMRIYVKDRSIDLSFYDVEKEIEGLTEILMLTRDELLVLSKDKEQCLFEIPYGAINDAEYDKKFLRGSKAVKINYNELDYHDLEFRFWIDDKDGKISSSELKQRSESLAEYLNRKRKESKITELPRRIRSANYFVITQNDINNNFSRFEPFEFERLVAKLFERKGYKTTVTEERGDFGVDVLAEAGSDKIAIQVKHWRAAVGGPDVHKTLGSMMTFGANRAMVVTSSDFTTQAYEIQKRGSPVELWNGSRLKDEFRQYLLDAINEARKSEQS